MELLIEHLGKGFGLVLMISLPVVLAAAGVGLIVGILQAVTQVQEQTISAAPKILIVFAILVLGGGVMMNMLTQYLRESVQLAFNEVPQNDIFLLPPKSRDPKHDRIKTFFKEKSSGQSTSRQLFNQPLPTGAGAHLDTGSEGSFQIKKPMPGLGVAEEMDIAKRRSEARSQ